jgi:hypothetical protein
LFVVGCRVLTVDCLMPSSESRRQDKFLILNSCKRKPEEKIVSENNFSLRCNDRAPFKRLCHRIEQGVVILHMEYWLLPSVRDFVHVSILCTFSNIPPAAKAAEIARSSQLSSEQPLGRAGGTAHPSQYCTSLLTPLLQPCRAGRCVGSIFFGLRPLWS